MPFTLSHPAAVLPFARVLRRLPLSALAIGSMIPDAPYFLLAQTGFHDFGHQKRGILLWDLPAALVLYVLWHALLKAPLATLLPERHRRRLAPLALQRPPLASPAHLALVAAAVLIGVATHIGWDSFTHRNGWSARQLPFLTMQTLPFPIPLLHRLPLYNLLQHLSSLAGALIVILAYTRWFRATPEWPAADANLPATPEPQKRRLAIAILLLAPVVGVAYAYWDGHHPGAADFAKKRLADFVVSGMSTAALLLSGFALRWRQRRRQLPPKP